MHLGNVETRLEAQVPDLKGRVADAAGFAAVMASGKPPRAGLSVYVLPTSLTGGQASALSGLYTQATTEGVGILILTHAVDGTGSRALGRISELRDEIIAALCGWAPSDTVGVFQLQRALMMPAGGGLMGYQIDFTINDQLRITP